MGHVSDHTGLRAFIDGVLVQRFCPYQPFLIVHVQLACQCTAGGRVSLARIDGKFTRAMAVAYDWIESGCHHLGRQTRAEGNAGLAKSPLSVGIAFPTSPTHQTAARASMSWRTGHKKTAVAASDINGVLFKPFAQLDKKLNQEIELSFNVERDFKAFHHIVNRDVLLVDPETFYGCWGLGVGLITVHQIFMNG